MATEGRERLLPLSCGSGKHRSVECLWATLATNVVAHSTPPQSTTQVVAPSTSALPALDSSPTRSASLSYSSFPRHTSKVGAVCVDAPVRFCAGGDQRWSSLPRHFGDYDPHLLGCEILNSQTFPGCLGLTRQVYRPAAVCLDSAAVLLCRFIE